MSITLQDVLAAVAMALFFAGLSQLLFYVEALQ